ncbi:MAG: SGNH/GDSL hydrolase family protein [Acidobacteria bacterium]|nr:SGNH/GDSL hydrolase family protein [Acidobacteriota bacterium]
MKNLIFFALLLTLSASALAQTPTPSPTPDAAAEKQRADRLQSRLNDFAQLGRYRDANAQVKPPAKNENRVVFLGDSITDGWKLAEYFPGQPYINRGISGQVTPQMLIRMREDVIAHQPKVMVLLAGTNDISGNYGPETNEQIEGNIKSIVELAHANGINVVLASVLPVSDYNVNKQGQKIVRTVQRPPERILALNQWIKAYCAEKGLVYLDYFTATVDDKGFLKAELADDGLHPNAAGYKIMQKLAADAIAVALKKKQKK